MLDQGWAEPPLVQVRGLTMRFPITTGVWRRQTGAVRAVEDVSFDIYPGETLGLVGESGCGKSTLGRALLRLHNPTAGSVRFGGTDLATLPPEKLRKTRPQMQMVFQDPHASLNPRLTVARIISEPLDEHTDWPRARKRDRVFALMQAVGLAQRYADRYPHEFSGGQRQRIAIARAVALNPRFVVCDEPIAALDVSIQAQVVNLLKDLQDAFGLTYLFISHDLSMVRHIADRVAVMYLGRIVEIAPRDALYTRPLHPYAQALLRAVPEPDPEVARAGRRKPLAGDVPSAASPQGGCAFRSRCPSAFDLCRSLRPELQLAEPGHQVACHLFSDTRTSDQIGVSIPTQNTLQGTPT